MPQRRRGCLRYHILRPAVTLTFDLQNLVWSSVGVIEYFLSMLSKLFKLFMRYRGNIIRPDERTNERTVQRDSLKIKKHNAFADIEGFGRHEEVVQEATKSTPITWSVSLFYCLVQRISKYRPLEFFMWPIAATLHSHPPVLLISSFIHASD